MVATHIYLNITIRILQIAFAATVLALSISLQHIGDDDVRFLNHSPTLSFVAAVGSLTIAGGLIGLALTWLRCLVKYGYVVDLLGVMLNLAAGTLLAVKVKWTKDGCPTEVEMEDAYNGPTEAAYGQSKWAWLIGDRCESTNVRCRFSRIASILSFIIVVMLLAGLAFGGMGKKTPRPAAARKERPDGDVQIDTGTQAA